MSNNGSVVRSVRLSENLSLDTQNLLLDFVEDLGWKLSKAQEKYGYSDGWMKSDWMDKCREDLLEHIKKGDPIDVAAYCAFLWYHDESTNKEIKNETY